MRENAYKKIVREYPFLIDNIYKISRTEARKLYAQGFPSAQEIIDRAKKKYSDIPSEAWGAFDAALAEQGRQTEQPQLSNVSKKNFTQFVNMHRRFVAACIVLALLLSFFTLVPAGRTLAAEAIRYITEIIGNRIEITVDGARKNIETADMDDIYIESSSFDELGSVGVEPFMLNCEWLELETVIYEKSFERNRLLATYRTDDQKEVYVSQTWGMESDFSYVVNSEGYEEKLTTGGRKIYFSIDVTDGKIEAYLVEKEFMLVINTTSMELMDKIIDELV